MRPSIQFSVVIPCYNADTWIIGTLESVIAQTLPPHEVFVIDDGSSDDSLNLITTFAKTSPVPILVLQSDHLGPAGARNLGIEAAIGDWIAFLDADDWWKPEHLERIYTAIETSGDLVYLAAAEHFSININRVVSRSDSPFDTLQRNIDHCTYFELYQKHGLLELSSSAIARHLLMEVGGFKPEFRGAEDMEMIMRAVYNHTLAYDPIPSSYYRCNNPDSHSRKFALDEEGLTANFRAFQSLRDRYDISLGILAGKAKTLASKSINLQKFDARQRVLQLAWPYLSKSQKLIFTAASYIPAVYLWINNLRNQIRGPQYKPRQVVQ